MNDPRSRAAERDKALVRTICNVSANFRGALAEWIQEELKDQRVSVQIIHQSSSGLIKSEAKAYLDDIEELDYHRLPAAIRTQKERVDEIFENYDEDPFDDLMYLEESTFRIERMARMIFRMRRILNELSEPDPQADNPDPEEADDV